MIFETAKFVGEIAVEMPKSIPLFEKKGIDYCCGGGKSLQEACDKAGVNVQEVVRELEAISPEVDTNNSSKSWPTISFLIQYLLDKHHAFTREQLALVGKLGSKVLMVHGKNHPELSDIMGIFYEMAEELEHHLLKEEQVAFPFLRGLEEKSEALLFPYEVFRNAPQRVLMGDHEAVGEQLAELRQLTNSYTSPPEACVTFQAFYRGLKDLEEDLHHHIHLENNVLFPMAERLAKSR